VLRPVASTSIFSVVNGVLLRPLPFAEPDRLVQIYGRNFASDRRTLGAGFGDRTGGYDRACAVCGTEHDVRRIRRV
jgi:hypothetical protein